jgi:hypothetical protein
MAMRSFRRIPSAAYPIGIPFYRAPFNNFFNRVLEHTTSRAPWQRRLVAGQLTGKLS